MQITKSYLIIFLSILLMRTALIQSPVVTRDAARRLLRISQPEHMSSLQVSVEVRCTEPFSPLLTPPHQKNDTNEEHSVDDGHYAPSDTPRRRLGEGNLLTLACGSTSQHFRAYHVKAKSEGECLASEVEQGRNLSGLWFVALMQCQHRPLPV